MPRPLSLNTLVNMSAIVITSKRRTLLHVAAAIWLLMIGHSALAVDIDAQRRIINQGVLGILSDGVRGSQIELVGDLATVLDDGYNMRILPIAGRGSVRAIEDLLLLRGVDVALVQADVLDYYKRSDLFPNIDRRLRYITKLYNEELHILASKDIDSIEGLRGKKVNFGPPSSGSYVTASLVFEKLRVNVQARDEDYQIALERLRQGEIEAWVRVGAKPLLQMESLPDWEGVHFLPVPQSVTDDTYVAAKLTSRDYPNLVKENKDISTIAVGSVMAVYNWPRESKKRQQLQDFARRFSASFKRLQGAAFHPKWREVDLTKEVPGWKRF